MCECMWFLRRTLRHAHLCTLSGTHMCERVHVSAPCGCVIYFSKRTLRFAPRLVKPPFGWGPLRSQKLHNFSYSLFLEFLRARARTRNENDVHAQKSRKWVSKEQILKNEGNFRKNPKIQEIAKILENLRKIKKFSKNDRFFFFLNVNINK